MRQWRTDQDRAHWLLVRWAAYREADSAGDFPPASMEPKVQGAMAELTRPEAKADRRAEFQVMSRAISRVTDFDFRLFRAVYQQYVSGPYTEAGNPDERRMAEDVGWSLGCWREVRDAGRKMFLDEYERLTEKSGDG